MRVLCLGFVSSLIPRRFSRGAAALLFASAAAAISPAAYAQNSGPNTGVPPADVQTTLYKVGDLDILKALLPLKLTDTQRTKLKSALQEILAAREEKRKEDYTAMRAITDEINKARTAALNEGTEIPPELETKILKAFADSEKRFQAFNKDALQKVFAFAKPLLTPQQMDTIEKSAEKMLGGKRVPREYAKKPASAPKEKVQDLALVTYIERILLYDRTVDLLDKLKPQTGTTPAASTETTLPPSAAVPAKP